MFTNALLIASVSAIKMRQGGSDDPTAAVDAIEIDFDHLDMYHLNVTEAYDEINDVVYPMYDTVSLEDIVDFLQA